MIICTLCKTIDACDSEDHPLFIVGEYKWRRPKKRNTRAWKRILLGDIWWDKKAIDKKEYKQHNRNLRYENNFKKKKQQRL